MLLIITGKHSLGRLEKSMLAKLLCKIFGHKWQIIETPFGCYAVCKRCLTKKDIIVVESGSGMDVDPVSCTTPIRK